MTPEAWRVIRVSFRRRTALSHPTPARNDEAHDAAGTLAATATGTFVSTGDSRIAALPPARRAVGPSH
jgi:hypothetical protein